MRPRIIHGHAILIERRVRIVLISGVSPKKSGVAGLAGRLVQKYRRQKTKARPI